MWDSSWATNIYILKTEDTVDWNSSLTIPAIGEISRKGDTWIEKESDFSLRRIFSNCADGCENGIEWDTGLVGMHYVEDACRSDQSKWASWRKSLERTSLPGNPWAGPGHSETPHALACPWNVCLTRLSCSHKLLQGHKPERVICCWDHLDWMRNWTQ